MPLVPKTIFFLKQCPTSHNYSFLKYMTVLQRSTVVHRCKFNIIVRVCILHLADHHTAGQSAEIMFGKNACPLRKLTKSSFAGIVCKPYLTSCGTALGFLHPLSIIPCQASFYWFISKLHQSPTSCLAQPVLQLMAMCLESQKHVF